MVLRKSVMKRKRKEDCALILDVEPKRTKVHAQRKFAQGSNVNSPVITPVQELIEKPESSGIDIVPDPVELLPIKRPNTEDFLTFLCFRGTPILPTNLNFFNTASIVDTNGQVHEIKTESPKNGPIDTSIIGKSNGSSDRPFIAFGVRKRADPIVISRQMDRKRRHALALQALRRKYQEQKMAKIRAVTISKLSERITNKTLVRTNSVSKTETVTKKSTIQKTKVLATKHVKVTTRTVKTTMRPKITPKMCLRSFRGRFVQRELQFRNLKKKAMPIIPTTNSKKIIKKVEEKKIIIRKNRSMSSEFSSDDNEPLATTSKDTFKRPMKHSVPKVLKKSVPVTKTPSELRVRVTRSNPLPTNKIAQRRQQIKKQILLSSSTPYVKLRHLRSQTTMKPNKKSINSTKGKNIIINEKISLTKNPRILRKTVHSITTKKPCLGIKHEKSKSEVTDNDGKVNVRSTKRLSKQQEKLTESPIIKVEKITEKLSKKEGTPSKKEEKEKIVKLIKKDEKVADKLVKKDEKGADKLVKKDEIAEVKLVKKVENVAVKLGKKDEKVTAKLVKKDEKSADKLVKKSEKSADILVKKDEKAADKLVKQDEKVANKLMEKDENAADKLMKKDEKAVDKVKKDEKLTNKIIKKDEQVADKLLKKDDKAADKLVKKDEKTADKLMKKDEKTAGKLVKKDEKPADKLVQKDEKVAVKLVKKYGIPKKKDNKKETSVVSLLENKEETVSPKILQKSKQDEKNVIERCDTIPKKTSKREESLLKRNEMKKEQAVTQKKTSLVKEQKILFDAKIETITVNVENFPKENTAIPTKIVMKKQDKSDEKSEKNLNTNKSSDIINISKETKIKETFDIKGFSTINKEDDLKASINKLNISEKKESSETPKSVVKSTETLEKNKPEKVLKSDKKTETLEKNKLETPRNVLKKTETIKEEIIINKPSKKEQGPRKKCTEKPKETEPKVLQRPSRKTKEAAAIYMEILSHKLVNESKIDDDDNVSIDSFPELPNVKKTEQRENEYRAKTTQNKEDKKDIDKKNDNEIMIAELSSQIIIEIPEETVTKDASVTKNEKKDDKPVQKKQEGKEILENTSEFASEDKPLIKKKVNLKQQKTEIKIKAEIVKPMDDIDKEKIQNEILREVQEKLGTNILTSSETNKNENVLKRKSDPLQEETIKSEKKKKNNDKIHSDKITKNETSEEIKTKNVPESKSKASNTADKKKEVLQQLPTTKNISKQLKPTEIEKKGIEEGNVRRQTRHSGQNTKNNDDDSDESFHVDVKIPRKKQVTRNKAPKTYKSFCDSDEDSLKWENDLIIKNVINTCSGKEVSSGESEESTTSDKISKTVAARINNKIKKFTKTKNKPKKDDPYFSDSDEEPLSKLTQAKLIETSTESIKKNKDEVIHKNLKTPEAQKKLKPSKPKTQKKISPVLETNDDNIKTSVKPKRECAKRPQNYLPMFSSSDDEEKLLLGFGIDSKEDTTKVLTPTAHIATTTTTLDLSSKDISRRFGKEKVNMSNEQIEQWLKDSALAGNSLKKENDEMLKFGEKIPTDTLLELSAEIDTQVLKATLLSPNEEKNVSKDESSLKPPSVSKVPILAELAQIKISPTLIKSQAQVIDRKLIFRKEIKNKLPNVSAFSVSNESSVYAFGEENEAIISTPFRRPSRRPSSTATSRSEDESKIEESTKSVPFRKPTTLKQECVKGSSSKPTFVEIIDENPTEATKISQNVFSIPAESLKPQQLHQKNKIHDEDKPLATSSPMVPPSHMVQKTKIKSYDRYSETSEDGKYKIPSSPSASSSSSAKLYKRQPKPKARVSVEICNPVNLYTFPSNSSPALLVEAPTFYPLDKEFQDPIEYIQKIRPRAEQFGICRIIPPSTFKPECRVTDDMRFSAYNQYVHKMLHRWGPNFKEFMAIKKYLKSQNITLTNSPWIGGMEIDLPRLYQTVQSLGGLKEVIEKKKWSRVSEAMKIPKSAQDRVTKLDDIYCKYLLPYETLSPAEREKLFDDVETEWAKRESKSLNPQEKQDEQTNESEDSDNESEECTIKGRNIALNAFYRIARNTMSMWFKNSEPPAEEVEQEFWKHVMQRQNHICVHSGSIDSGSWGYGFAVTKNSPFARHAWNLKVLTNNSGSVLRSMGPIMGVTVPTLHVGMVFSSCCWYRDPHSLPWIEYLHTGGNKIWYGIPDSMSEVFHNSLTKLAPNYCKKKTLWLNSDTAMVPPSVLVENGVSLSRVVQEPGQFIVVFPKAFTSSVSTGYVVSESVYFAPPQWLLTAQKVFKDLRDSCEPSMFSLDRLIVSIANDGRSNIDIFKKVIPLIQEIASREKVAMDKLKAIGLGEIEKLPTPEIVTARRRKKQHGEEGDYECDICRMNLFISMVMDTVEDGVYCLDHALKLIEEEKIQSKNCKLMYTYDSEELLGLIEKINVTIENKLQKKIPSKFSGMPTLLR